MEPASTLITAALVLQVLGPALPASLVRVPRALKPVTHSVQFFDNKREDALGESLTNAVLGRKTREATVRNYTNSQTGEVNDYAAKRNLAAQEAHCKLRLNVEGVPNAAAECGSGFSR